MQPDIALVAEDAAPPRPGLRRIEPSRGFVPVDFGEVWRFRGLLFYLTWRDVKARYKQTFLSGFWAVFRPFASMALMAAVFGGLAGITSGSHVPYPLFLYAGVLPWTYFSSSLTNGTTSITNNANLISKAYFPRVYAPFAAVAAPLVDFALAFVVLLGLFAWYRTPPSWHVVFLPLLIALLVSLGLGVALWLSGLSVKYRDLPFALPFLVQMGMYVTPIIYPVSLVPERWRWLVTLNPLTGVFDAIRWSLLGTAAPSASMLLVSVAAAFVLLTTGLYFFRWTERTIADLV